MTAKEIKQSARAKLKERYLKCSSACLLYFIITLVLTYLLNYSISSLKNTVLIAVLQALFAIISLVLGYGLIENIISITERKTTSITKFIDISLLNMNKYSKIIINILINIFIPLILFAFSLFYLFGTLWANMNNFKFLCFYPNLLPLAGIIACITFIILIYFLIKFSITPYMYYSHKDMKCSEIVKNSKKLMKGETLNYIILILSFLPYILLLAVLMLIINMFVPLEYTPLFAIIFYTLIKPYIAISTLIFYENLESKQ